MPRKGVLGPKTAVFNENLSKSLLNLSKSLSLDLGLLSGPSPQVVGVLAREICKDIVDLRQTFGLYWIYILDSLFLSLLTLITFNLQLTTLF